MVKLIQQPTIVMGAGNKRKKIAEYVGRLDSATESLGIAHMKSPADCSEPGQIPDFAEVRRARHCAVRYRGPCAAAQLAPIGAHPHSFGSMNSPQRMT